MTEVCMPKQIPKYGIHYSLLHTLQLTSSLPLHDHQILRGAIHMKRSAQMHNNLVSSKGYQLQHSLFR